MHGMRGQAGQEWTDDGYQLQPRSKTLSLVGKVIDKIVRLSPGERPDLRPSDVRRSLAEPGSADRLLPEPFDLGEFPSMRDINEVIRRKEIELDILREQITALRICIPLLEDDQDEAVLVETAQTRS